MIHQVAGGHKRELGQKALLRDGHTDKKWPAKAMGKDELGEWSFQDT